ncbi:MAG: acetyltransferase [Candidatus Calescibacterium sp.]|nr:acetyltransferase [Candidatus Calescibacterium sp.]MCX7733762.1 acetyltransferase [bacterium]MDW8086674.1 acyltransferase [Candidatus Calescibacterium sp.]
MEHDRFFHKLSLVESDEVGEGTRIWAFTHVLKGSKIGRFCNIGEHCYIESGVVIGDYCTIKNGICLWEGITLEEHVFLGPCAVFTNDKYPRSRNKDWELKRTLIRRYATVGAGAVVLCGIEIGRFSLIGAGAVVTKSVPDFAIVYGNPARIKGYACACGRVLLNIQKIKRNNGKKIDVRCKFCGRIYRYRSKTLEWIGGEKLP